MDFDAKTLNSFSIASDFASTPSGGKDPYLITFDPIAFRYIGRRVVGSSNQRKFTKIGEDFNLCFKLIKSDSKLVKSLLFSYGFLQCSSKNLHCNLIWTNTHLSTNSMRQLKSWQRMNHFPRSWMLTTVCTKMSAERVLYMDRNILILLIPDFFCTPLNDKNSTKLVNCCKEIENGKQSPFIVKPAGGSFGKGIFFLSKAEEVYSIDNSQKWVISRYIERPLLINGLKWDLRIYVLVTSFYPLIVYMYSDGLARFAVHTYKDGKTNFDDLNQHLTNYVLNKTSEYFIRNNDCSVEDMGHKWTLGALLRHLEEHSGIDTELLMVRIEDIVIKSLLSIQPRVAAMCRKLNLHPKCCFELFGFDILVDEHLKPWLLEINLSPSLSCDSPLDTLLKTHLFCDVLNVASIPLVNDRNMENECYFSDEEDELADEGQKRRKKRSNNEKLDNGNEQDLITFSSERMSALYLERVELLFEKLKLENKRRGHFNRIFPRRTTWRMYCSILEDCGQEQWDKALHTLLSAEYNQDTTPPKLTMYDVQLTHEQLMNAEKYPKRELLDPTVSNIALAEALEEAKCYKKKKVYTTASSSGDFRPYPSALPKLRPSARRRTKSQCLADELKQEKLEKKKEEMAAATTTASTDLNISSNSPTAPLLELDPNLPSLSLLKENEGNKFITISENQKMLKKNGVK
ncbi:unnamed protein product [Meloidogyne enterolobii]|uniref:Uncharacterized protein n=1 Tax=Meloidogyne enterolobii TaxID=390850 RepID=A0ACB1B1V7_MELEN